jgi:hypothetical protein
VAPRLAQTAAAVAAHVIGAADVAVIRSVLARIPPAPRTLFTAERDMSVVSGVLLLAAVFGLLRAGSE